MEKLKDFLQDHPLVKHLLLMVAVSFGILLLTFVFIKIYARQGQEYVLPDYTGCTLEDIQQDNPLELVFVVTDSIYESGVAPHTILRQDPEQRPRINPADPSMMDSTKVKKHRKVYLTIAAMGPGGAVLPDIKDMSVRSAVKALDNAGMVCGRLRFVDDPTPLVLEMQCKGKLLSAGAEMPQGSVIDLTVGRGERPASIIVPFVIGRSVPKVRMELHSALFNVGQEHFDGVTNRNTAVCYRMEPDYTGVTRYPLGTSVEVWYCDASEADVERIISNFKVDSTKIVPVSADVADDAEYYYDEDDVRW